MYERLIGKPSTDLDRADHGDHFHVYYGSNGSQLRGVVTAGSKLVNTSYLCPEVTKSLYLAMKSLLKGRNINPCTSLLFTVKLGLSHILINSISWAKLNNF